MSARALVVSTAVLLSGCTPPDAPASAASAASPDQLVEHCRDKDGWSDDAPPARIFGNVYQVGTCGIVALLVTSDQGHILIDAATDKAAPGILRNIATLGFDPRDVKILLNGHEHNDHAGGFAAIKRATGARLLVRAEAKAGLESGDAGPDDPQRGMNDPFPAVRVDGVVTDGQVVRLGPLALTAHATPGHTPGSTSWSWRSCEGDRCHDMVFADSLTPFSSDQYRFSDQPTYVAAFRAGLDRIAGLGCDILITPHPGASNLYTRLAGDAPLVDPRGCADYAGNARARLDARLAKEAMR